MGDKGSRPAGFYLDEWPYNETLHPVSAEAAREYADEDHYVTTPTTKMMLDEEVELWMEGIEEEDAAWREIFSPNTWIILAAILAASIIWIVFSIISAFQF